MEKVGFDSDTLTCAIASGDIKLLVKHEADIDVATCISNICVQIQAGNVEMLKYLTKIIRLPANYFRHDIIRCAIRSKNLRMFKLMINF